MKTKSAHARPIQGLLIRFSHVPIYRERPKTDSAPPRNSNNILILKRV